MVDGVTESLTTDLSRVRGADVVARNTAFTYKGKPLKVKTIGRELNVRYVLEGSVQLGGNRMRVNVQLIDAETGNHLWAERFDKTLADLFDMQDEIVARLAGALNTELVASGLSTPALLAPSCPTRMTREGGTLSSLSALLSHHAIARLTRLACDAAASSPSLAAISAYSRCRDGGTHFGTSTGGRALRGAPGFPEPSTGLSTPALLARSRQGKQSVRVLDWQSFGWRQFGR